MFFCISICDFINLFYTKNQIDKKFIFVAPQKRPCLILFALLRPSSTSWWRRILIKTGGEKGENGTATVELHYRKLQYAKKVCSSIVKIASFALLCNVIHVPLLW